MLGIIIGIASVVLIVALGDGSKQQVLKDINQAGTSTLSISAGANIGSKDNSATETLTLDDMYVLGQQSYIKAVSPELSSAMTIRQDNVERTAQVSGVNVGYDKLQNVQFVSGRMFTQADLSNFRQYAVISDRTKKELFGTQTAVGKVILLDGVPSKIVGVLKQSSMYQDRSLAVWLPYTTFQARFSGASNHLSGITVSLQQGYSSALAVEGVTNLLTKRHGKKDFSIFNSDSLAKTIEKTATTLTLLISAIAVISLLVGGIGVMNIMLVSVTERTSEIGVRMAVGARYRDIIQQFLIEAIVVCFVGGVIGVALAFLVGGLLTLFDIKVLFSVGSIVLAVACSSLIGLVFGFMPAHRAAQMNPIDALNKA
ncbi:MAG: ABC transporter permease [Moraxella sp.]|nr:ABC transporter permease [Moraxella sp.]